MLLTSFLTHIFDIMTLKDRLKWLAQQKGLSIRAFEEKCGLGRGNVSNMSADGSIGSDKLTKIIDAFPTVDAYWLITGKDDPTGVLNFEGFDDMPSSHDPQLLNKLIAQAEEIGRLKERIRQLESERGANASDADSETVARAV